MTDFGPSVRRVRNAASGEIDLNVRKGRRIVTKRSRSPRPEKMFTVCPVTSKETMPKGMASGKVSRIVMGWMNDSN